jgi:F5/8 type C domain-containing protein/carboxypeptidase family protein
MKRFLATPSGWRGGALVGALLLAVALAGPAAAKNSNLTATAKYSASSEWQSDQGNTSFVAAKAFDGDITTRWNVDSNDYDGSWLEADWDQPVTVNKVVMYEFLDRVKGFRVQTRDAGSNDWKDAYVAEGDAWTAVKGGIPNNAIFTIRFAKPVQTAGLRILNTETTSAPTVWELEAWNNPAGTVTGTVTDASGAPIAGVTVSAGGDHATTDAQGKYNLITDVGKVNVSASKSGAYRTRIARGVDVAADASVSHDFVLLPVPPNLSLTATAVSSSDYDDTDYVAAKAKDGVLTTRWNSADGDVAGSYLEMQWAQAQTFNQVTIREAIGRIRNYTLQSYDEAGAKYVDILTANAPAGTGDRVYGHLLANPVTSKRLRMLINVADDLPSIYELEVSNAPTATAKIVVKDVASGNPVPKATITSDLGVILGTTDDTGAVNLLVEPDDYVVTATADGYLPGAPVAFTINAGDTQDVVLTAPATGPNLAKTAKASASTETDTGDNPAALAADGDPSTYWLANEYANQYIALTWDQPTRFTVVQLRGFKGVIGRSYLQILADDGATWVDVPNTVISPESGDGSGNKPADFYFPDGITTKGVRYYITATNSTTNIPGLSEFIVYNAPIPKP